MFLCLCVVLFCSCSSFLCVVVRRAAGFSDGGLKLNLLSGCGGGFMGGVLEEVVILSRFRVCICRQFMVSVVYKVCNCMFTKFVINCRHFNYCVS